MADEHLISLQPGTVIAGRYEVVKCLGAGSMGLVYACRHRELQGHMVAVKVLFPEVAQDKIAAARFRNEIFASYGVSHPNVVRAYEYLRDGDLVAYTMEYVGGGDLAERLQDCEPLPISEIISLLSQISAGVQAIHDARIVHRDLKPENILLSKEGTVKIADFGIARTGHGPKLTEHGGVVGTIDYVSPEYMLNSQVDWRSDIYAIGILGYEMATGKSPFRGDSVYATMTKRLKTDPEPPSLLRPECPEELDRIVLKAMARNPEERYQSAAEMFYDLQPLLAETGQHKNSLGLEVPRSGAHEARNGGSSAYLGPVVDFGDAEPGVSSAYVPQQVKHEPSIESPGSGVFVRSGPTAPSGVLTGGPVSAAFEHVETAYKPGPSRAFEQKPLRNDPGGSRFAEHEREIIEIASQYFTEGTIFEPSNMQAVRQYNELVSPGWQGDLPRTQVITNGASIDEARVQRLTELVEKVERSMWVEMVTLVVAILIGVGVGFFFVRLTFPSLMQRGATAHAERAVAEGEVALEPAAAEPLMKSDSVEVKQ